MDVLKRQLQDYVSSLLNSNQTYPFVFSSSSSLVTASLAKQVLSVTEGRVFVIGPSDDELRLIYDDFRFFSPSSVYFPPSGVSIGKKCDISSSVISSLKELYSAQHEIILVSLWSLSSLIPCFDSLIGELHLSVGDSVDYKVLSEHLVSSGYTAVQRISSEGEFALKGEVAEIFPFSSNCAYRILLNFDTIEKIYSFFPFDSEKKSVEENSIDIVLSSDERNTENIKYDFFTSIFTKKDSFIFLGKEKLLESHKHILNRASDTFKESYASGVQLSFKELVPDFNEVFKDINRSRIYIRQDIVLQNEEVVNFSTEGPRSFFGAFNMFKAELESLCKEGYSSYVFVHGMLQAGRFKNMLFTQDDKSSINESNTNVVNASISSGFCIPSLKLIVFTDEEIFRRRRFVKTTLSKIESSPLDSFSDLNEGDLVVHINYGIARFVSLERMDVNDSVRDYIKLEFKDEEFYYVPIEMANLIERYIGDSSKVSLSSLSSSLWEHKKKRAAESARQLAEELISLYAKRKQTQGFAHAADSEYQYMFEAGFCYDETPDQRIALSEIKKDMESDSVMDRLLCGDVGYGKTEIAFRSAFKAVMSGKQIAFLAPTTILVHQHFLNFSNRVKNFPLEVRELSRTVKSSIQKRTIEDIASGKADVIFGTQRLLQKDIHFKNLGLLVIDEEQRFGVKDKEKIKEIKTNVDTLSLSATPIPRTLYMSLLKIRDISTLKTPPQDRKSVITYIGEISDFIIKEAIEKELMRGGQVFYLHNRVEDILSVKAHLSSLVPGIIVECAHGQMNPDVAEDIMESFVNGGINVLISTTIIENGIDIPNANTIIVDNATIYGTSQLYQLRGRVGRSSKQAYAYLLYKSDKTISEDAIDRLKVISENIELGSGFKVAMRDLEMRGAGNLLGKEQSGFVSDVGLDLYIRLIDESIKKLEGKEIEDNEVFLDIESTAFIPDSYISKIEDKMEVYKKIASCTSEGEYESIVSMVETRFGTPPTDVLSLFYIAKLKICAKKLHIASIREKNGQAEITFSKVSLVNIDKVLNLIKTSGGIISPSSRKAGVLMINTKGVNSINKALFIQEKLERLL